MATLLAEGVGKQEEKRSKVKEVGDRS